MKYINKNTYIRVLYSQRIPFHYNLGYERNPFVSHKVFTLVHINIVFMMNQIREFYVKTVD